MKFNEFVVYLFAEPLKACRRLPSNTHCRRVRSREDWEDNRDEVLRW